MTTLFGDCGLSLRRSLNIVGVALGVFVLCPVSTGHVLAQSATSADVIAQTADFDRQKSELVSRLKELKAKIDNAGSIIDKKGNSAEVARETIDEMRAVVSPLLAAVADNGEVSQLGARVLKNATDRKEMLERDTRFDPEERRKLVEAWTKRIKASEEATKELEKARVEFLQLMLMLQRKEALIAEWAALKAHDEVLNTIRQLTNSLKETSADVSDFIARFERGV